MHWIMLYLAIAFELMGTLSMKISHGFAKTLPSVLIFVFYGLSFACMTVAMKSIDLSIAYAVWCGVGILGITVISILLFDEVLTLPKFLYLFCIFVGVIGLNLSGRH